MVDESNDVDLKLHICGHVSYAYIHVCLFENTMFSSALVHHIFFIKIATNGGYPNCQIIFVWDLQSCTVWHPLGSFLQATLSGCLFAAEPCVWEPQMMQCLVETVFQLSKLS
jgi:hypothetical protein